tara:strand:+ start:10247 stop:11155 length:909 start_codon:yes stop_codon:yes gene_type:complete
MDKEILKSVRSLKSIESNVCITIYFTGSIEDFDEYISKKRQEADLIKNAFKKKLVKTILFNMLSSLEEDTNLFHTNLVLFGYKDGFHSFKLPYKPDKILYYCDKEFKIDILEDKLDPPPKLGILFLKPEKALFYQYHPKLEAVCISQHDIKKDYTSLDGLIKRHFSLIPHVFDFVVYTTYNLPSSFPSKYTIIKTSKTIKELNSEFKELYIKIRYKDATKHLDEIFERLTSNDEKRSKQIVYGQNDIYTALEYQQLKLLYTTKLLSSKIDLGPCQIIKIPKALKQHYEQLEDYGGALGWTFY